METVGLSVHQNISQQVASDCTFQNESIFFYFPLIAAGLPPVYREFTHIKYILLTLESF